MVKSVSFTWPAVDAYLFIRTKENVNVRKESNSHRIDSEQQHGRRFIVLENQYGRRDVMQKRFIILWTTMSACLVTWLQTKNLLNKYMDLELHPETQDVEPS